MPRPRAAQPQQGRATFGSTLASYSQRTLPESTSIAKASFAALDPCFSPTRVLWPVFAETLMASPERVQARAHRRRARRGSGVARRQRNAAGERSGCACSDRSFGADSTTKRAALRRRRGTTKTKRDFCTVGNRGSETHSTRSRWARGRLPPRDRGEAWRVASMSDSRRRARVRGAPWTMSSTATRTARPTIRTHPHLLPRPEIIHSRPFPIGRLSSKLSRCLAPFPTGHVFVFLGRSRHASRATVIRGRRAVRFRPQAGPSA
jgi:hypothetical protein